ncbi:MAG TPA: hypothetical protein G4N92_03040 [Anaerolineae bacterium]|nr:hypothetical protein [Anaerolineae bacterium]
MINKLIVEVIPLIGWLAITTLGGWWIVRRAFHLNSNEELLLGFGFGLFFQNWLVNIFGRFIAMPNASWISSVVVFIVGLLLNFPKSKQALLNLFRPRIKISQWFVLLLMTYVFFIIGRGMAILDEFQTLPLVSQMAAGDIPPHFPLDPEVIYNYHYFPYLLAAQFMRLADLFPWTALDIMTALILSLSTLVLALWVYRITRSRLAGVSAAIFNFFAGGTRWLMLLLPNTLISKIDSSIVRIGSGLNSGPDLLTSLINPWAAQGTGPMPIPFAFANGFNPPNSIGLGYTNFVVFFLIFFLMTTSRQKQWSSHLVHFAMLVSLDLTHEVTFLFLIFGTVFSIVFLLIKNGKRNMPVVYKHWLIIITCAGIVSLFQGGVLTGVAQDLWLKFTSSGVTKEAYQAITVKINYIPTIIDAHLGKLSLINPIQLFVFILETGPMLALLPVIILWGYKAIRAGRWFEGFFLGITLCSMGLVFVLIELKHGSIGSLARAQNYYLVLIKLIAVPFFFLWLKKRREFVKIITFGLILITMFSGITIFGLELIAAKDPNLTVFITELDARIMKEFWNTLEPDELVFDPGRYRAAVIFGKPTDSSFSWFLNKPKWEQLVKNPDPYELLKSGFDYMYYDDYYIRTLEPDVRTLLEEDCIHPIREYKYYLWGMRRFVDIQQCQ